MSANTIYQRFLRYSAPSYYERNYETEENSYIPPTDGEIIRVITNRYEYYIKYCNVAGKYVIVNTNNPMLRMNQ
jgi:hypothetical protein